MKQETGHFVHACITCIQHFSRANNRLQNYKLKTLKKAGNWHAFFSRRLMKIIKQVWSILFPGLSVPFEHGRQVDEEPGREIERTGIDECSAGEETKARLHFQ